MGKAQACPPSRGALVDQWWARRCARNDGVAMIAHRMPGYTETTHVNTAVTIFFYRLPTIGLLSPARGWRVAYHVAFEDPGFGRSTGVCRLVRARRVFDRAAGLHRNRGHIGPDCRPFVAGTPPRQLHQ